jgi:hypothetical protein
MGQQILDFMVLTNRAKAQFETSLGIENVASGTFREEEAADYHQKLPDQLLNQFPQDVKFFCRFMDRTGFDALEVLDIAFGHHQIPFEEWKFFYVQVIRIGRFSMLGADILLNFEQFTPLDRDSMNDLKRTLTSSLTLRTLGYCMAIAATEENSCLVMTVATVGPSLVADA